MVGPELVITVGPERVVIPTLARFSLIHAGPPRIGPGNPASSDMRSIAIRRSAPPPPGAPRGSGWRGVFGRIASPREAARLVALRRSLAVYRKVFGQPREDDLLEFILREIPAALPTARGVRHRTERRRQEHDQGDPEAGVDPLPSDDSDHNASDVDKEGAAGRAGHDGGCVEGLGFGAECQVDGDLGTSERTLPPAG